MFAFFGITLLVIFEININKLTASFIRQIRVLMRLIYNKNDISDSLTSLTKEDDQMSALSSIAEKCTTNDLKMIVRLIKGDLRMTAGAKHILDGLHKDAHESFNSSRQIDTVLSKIVEVIMILKKKISKL